MLKAILAAAVMVSLALSPVYAQGKADKAKEWCTAAHMKEMDAEVDKITDSKKRKSAQEHLDESKAAFKKKDTAGCVKHMELAHKIMGL